jgi:hypothetical protein
LQPFYLPHQSLIESRNFPHTGLVISLPLFKSINAYALSSVQRCK